MKNTTVKRILSIALAASMALSPALHIYATETPEAAPPEVYQEVIAEEEAEPQIPAELEGTPVIEIGDGCFQGRICLERVQIPEGVARIGDYAFECCGNLKKLYLPRSLRSIGAGAFSGCCNLSLADFQEGLESVGKGAFLYCKSLVYSELPHSLTSLGAFAFAGCDELAKVVFLGDEIKELSDRLFYGDLNLRSVVLPNRVDRIGKRAFSGCETLKHLFFSEPVQELGEYAFENCEALGSIGLNVSRLPIGAFKNCEALTWLNTEELQAIDFGAFMNCGVDSLWLPEDIAEIAPGAFAQSRVKSLSFQGEGDCLYQIADGSLYGDGGKTLLAWFPQDPYAEEAETSFTLPEGVERIEAYAFQGAPLETVVLPASLREIGERAFLDCEAELVGDLESVAVSPEAFGPADEPEQEPEEPGAEPHAPETIGSLAGEKNLFREEDFRGYREISNEEFESWSQNYLSWNGDALNADTIPYILAYKGEVVPHFMAMTAVQNHDPDMWAEAASFFGEDFEEMYLMMDHGLFTELRRGRMEEDLILYSGLYDSQLMAAAGTDRRPDTEELIEAIGSSFTDPIMISTTTDPAIAANFGDTLFCIYASAEAMNRLGAVSIDSLIASNEKEILMSEEASYRILDVGVMSIETEDYEGNSTNIYRNYIKVELLGPAEN